jgi:alpha-D-ribose 1-methylphosphonate 5-triphosphate diphosphatase
VYRITNGRIVTEETVIEGFDLLIRDNRIEGIVPAGEGLGLPEDNRQVIDAAGGYVAPGFIDLHSDYIEHMAAPRPTALMDFRLSLRETEKELITHGITTMFHSLSLYKWTEYTYKPIRERQNVIKFLELISQSHTGMHLVRHRFHARFEIDNIDEIDSLRSYITGRKIHLLSFMDHTPGQGQYRDLEIYRSTVKGYNNLSDGQIEDIIDRHRCKEKLTLEKIAELAELAREHHIPLASHDDDSLEKLILVRSFGTVISEFPITMEIARQAKEMGLYTVGGAPNVLLGGSHSGNLSAAEAIREGCINILCSDYYPAAMLHAVFELHRSCGLDLAAMIRLVTLNPAKAIGMDVEVGSIRPGKLADLLIIEKIEPDFPVITSVFVDGRLVQKTNYRNG